MEFLPHTFLNRVELYGETDRLQEEHDFKTRPEEW